MSYDELIILCVFIFMAAFLYSSVGHGGASGYLAVFALFGIAPEAMKPSGLILNILVSSIATFRFYRAKHFKWEIFTPITLSALPFSFLGGFITLPGDFYKTIAGILLLVAAFRFLSNKVNEKEGENKIKIIPAIFFGICIGFLSGLIGVGGGIFLSPLIIFMGWATAKQTAGISAAFILVNSVSGLAGHLYSIQIIPDYIFLLVIPAFIGGNLGAKMGSISSSNKTIYQLLALVLIIAGIKLLFV